MIALHQNQSSFYTDNIVSFFDNQNSYKESFSHYTSVLKKLNKVDSYLNHFIDNLDITLDVQGIDTVDKIDDILLNLESISDINEEILSNQEYKKWYFMPIRYLIDRIETSNYSLQGLLGAKQAEIMFTHK